MRTVVLGGRPQELEQLIERRRALGLDKYDEMWEGDYHVAPEAHSRHGILDDQLAVALHPFAMRAGLIGSGPFNLGTANNFRVPDRGFHRSVPGVVWVESAPVVVEILSPDDETFEKFDFYAAHGVREVLVAFPDEHVVLCYALAIGDAHQQAASLLLGVDMAELSAQISWPD